MRNFPWRIPDFRPHVPRISECWDAYMWKPSQVCPTERQKTSTRFKNLGAIDSEVFTISRASRCERFCGRKTGIGESKSRFSFIVHWERANVHIFAKNRSSLSTDLMKCRQSRNTSSTEERGTFWIRTVRIRAVLTPLLRKKKKKRVRPAWPLHENGGLCLLPYEQTEADDCQLGDIDSNLIDARMQFEILLR